MGLLRVDDLDLARNVLVLRRGKGAKTLEVSLHAEIRAAVLARVRVSAQVASTTTSHRVILASLE